MTTDTFLQVAQLGTILIGSLGIAVAMRSHRRQLNAQMFIEFSSRFQHVVRLLPAEAWIADGHRPIPPPSPELTTHCLQLFHLVANLYHLHKQGYISRDLWRPAQLGIKRILEHQLFQREWFSVEPAFSHVPEYCRYVRRLISDGNYAQSRSLEATR
jgi:hypothetical protein